MKKHIDRIEQLDLARLHAADIRWLFAVGPDANGRTWIETPVWRVALSVWIEAAEYFIERDGLQEELAHLAPFMFETPEDRQRAHAEHLDMCLSEIYRDPKWVKFVPYNRAYHPDLLAETTLVRIIPDCCRTPEDVPLVQIIAETETPVVPCPICGQRTTFRVSPEEHKRIFGNNGKLQDE